MQIRTVLEGIGNDLSSLTGRRRSLAEYCPLTPMPIQLLRPLTALLLCTLVLATDNSVRADQLQDLAKKAGMKILSDGESSSDSQKKTVASLPFNQMTAPNRQRAQKIVEGCNQYRRLPTLQYSIDEPIYRYLLQHPDVAVSTWRVMGISRFEMWQTGPMEYEAKAVDGTEGVADILYQDANQMLFVCEGNYHNLLLLRPLEASALIWFRAVYAPGADGTHIVTQRADVFVRFPSAGLSTVAKMLTPVTNSMMDRNLFEISLYSSMMSRAVRDEPEWVIQVADQMEGVLPQRKNELMDVARLLRKTSVNGLSRNERVNSVDRSVIMSPQLLFFDPPKSGTTIVTPEPVSASVPVKTAELTSGGRAATVRTASAPTEIIPAAKAAQSTKTESKKSQSGDGFALQPVVPSVESAATDPAGRGASSVQSPK